MADQIGEYKLLSRAGSGGYGQCYVVIKKNDNRAYVLKTINPGERTKEKINALRNEIDKLEELNQDPKNGYIPIIYYTDKDLNNSKPKPYYVMDLFSRENFYYYMENSEYDLSEKQAKFIFKKILSAIQFCHNRNICHLDIKPLNIVFDKDFQPIILDYGVAQKFVDEKNNIKIFKEPHGTQNYCCPEMWDNKIYDGRKADIFSLGAVLFNLVTGKAGFITSEGTDEFYKYIRGNSIEEYWKNIMEHLQKPLSENFKNLYISMISFYPENRPEIGDILISDWMNEINNLQGEEYTALENEVRDKLLTLYEKIQEENGVLNLGEKIQQMGYETRSGNKKDGKLRYYDKTKTNPKKIPNDRININRFIKINGLSDGVKFMDDLVYKIDEKLNEVCFVGPSEEDLKFVLNYKDEEKGECEIEVELYEYETGGYLLEFLRTKGGIPNYYHHFLELRKFIFEIF